MKLRFIFIGSLLGALLGCLLGLGSVLPATYSIIHTLTWATISSLLQATFWNVTYFAIASGVVIGGIAGYRHWWYGQHDGPQN